MCKVFSWDCNSKRQGKPVAALCLQKLAAPVKENLGHQGKGKKIRQALNQTALWGLVTQGWISTPGIRKEGGKGEGMWSCMVTAAPAFSENLFSEFQSHYVSGLHFLITSVRGLRHFVSIWHSFENGAECEPSLDFFAAKPPCLLLPSCRTPAELNVVNLPGYFFPPW